ncbi:MAG: UDP-N-acetylglucosamine 2-epimerase (non-hydrolyzing) [bacterium]|nr:UDP-N-acetylglucosamine 2-epimerase (non-hydrolyzing) [bacterium]
MKIIATIVGARPQFIKCALLSRALREGGFAERLIHTGQHYAPELSDVFFAELGIPQPDANLEVGSDTHGRQTGRMMIALEEEFERHRPDAAFVFGDTNSTLAGALTAVKMGIPLIHVEAGMRSRDRSMPEEHNRIVADHVADVLFCHNAAAAERLEDEAVAGDIVVCGDLMRETLSHFLPRALGASSYPARLGLAPGAYGVLTVHRPVNADDSAALAEILHGAAGLGRPVIFPAHPRVQRHLAGLAEAGAAKGVRLVEPLGYLDMLALTARAAVVLTDSGGLQKEATFLGIPCVTLRSTTEWTETIDLGLNRLAGDRPAAERIVAEAERVIRLRAGWDARKLDDFRGRRLEKHFGPLNVSSIITQTLTEFLEG